MFILKNPEGKFLDTDYHSKWRHGKWRDKPRLYKTKQGLRSALRGLITPAMYSIVGEPPLGPLDRKGYWQEVRERFARVAKIPTDKYFELLAKDGYELLEAEVIF